MRSLPEFLLEKLKSTNPDAVFTGNMPKIYSSTGENYFVKAGSPSENEQYMGEAQSLEAMGHAAPGLVPKVFSYGADTNGSPYFISEYKNMTGLTEEAAEILAKRLAVELHQYKSQRGFGFEVPTYCGATRQKNGWHDTWEKCYDALIGNLLEGLSKKGYEDLVGLGEEVRNSVIPKLLGQLNIQPVLLHGDLWSGNVGVDSSTGQPVIFDPSSYYGHNEADLAIARIFGGFPESFYAAYHRHYPKAEPVSQHSLRVELYELYHYLNHTLLFGVSRYLNKLSLEGAGL
ncbi:fructosamine kinase [Macrolepiota fuliginosa MF-IS2]|uniref:protein-ribulosamine 3-kinase n=1 Tax=Macrolepiota fuliginosa MF-IS2 TaxID=1400762 RepID=A0A9P6CAF2_9AGAR|nr:fructosamine kinase [Macrolepiota fuliginosa MF-IS2]